MPPNEPPHTDARLVPVLIGHDGSTKGIALQSLVKSDSV